MPFADPKGRQPPLSALTNGKPTALSMSFPGHVTASLFKSSGVLVMQMIRRHKPSNSYSPQNEIESF